jgi:hypothetical protein
MLAQRHTISYDRATGQIDYTLRPSRSFADAALHEWIVIGKQDISSIDVATLYAIADSITVPELGTSITPSRMKSFPWRANQNHLQCGPRRREQYRRCADILA